MKRPRTNDFGASCMSINFEAQGGSSAQHHCRLMHLIVCVRQSQSARAAALIFRMGVYMYVGACARVYGFAQFKRSLERHQPDTTTQRSTPSRAPLENPVVSARARDDGASRRSAMRSNESRVPALEAPARPTDEVGTAWSTWNTFLCAIYAEPVGRCVYSKSAGPLSNRGNCVNSTAMLFLQPCLSPPTELGFPKLLPSPSRPRSFISNSKQCAASRRKKMTMVHFFGLSLKILARPYTFRRCSQFNCEFSGGEKLPGKLWRRRSAAQARIRFLSWNWKIGLFYRLARRD